MSHALMTEKKGVVFKTGTQRLNCLIGLMTRYNKNTAKFLCGGCTSKGHNGKDNHWPDSKKYLCEFQMQNALYLTLVFDAFTAEVWDFIIKHTEMWLEQYSPDELRMHQILIKKEK